MTDFEKRVADLERAVRHLYRERWDLAYPPGHDEREANCPSILATKPPTKSCEPTETVGPDLKLDEASR